MNERIAYKTILVRDADSRKQQRAYECCVGIDGRYEINIVSFSTRDKWGGVYRCGLCGKDLETFIEDVQTEVSE